VIVSAVGFRGHGKTIQFASLFHMLKEGSLARQWDGFYTQGLDEDDLNTIYMNVEMLRQGILPEASPKNFPRPTMIRITGMPGQPNCTWLCYDTGGECFEKPRQLVQYANFVRCANTVMFLVCTTGMHRPSVEMFRLMNTYLSGMGELGGRTKNQHLIVVFTKADELTAEFKGEWSDLRNYLSKDAVEAPRDFARYVRQMTRISARLKSYTREFYGASEFMNAARRNFKSLEFCAVSALGAKPLDDNKRLGVHVSPKRILDPMLWLMLKSKPAWRGIWQRWL
jgi:hypothetical protein